MLSLARRLLRAPLVVLVLAGLLALGIGFLLRRFAPSIAILPNIALGGAIRNAVVTTVVLVATVLLQRKRPRDVGLAASRAVPDTLRGFLVGATLLTTVIAVLALTGSYRILGWAELP